MIMYIYFLKDNELQRAVERNRIKPNLETGNDKETSISNQMIQT